MNLGTNNRLVKREIFSLRETTWWTPVHPEGFPVFSFAGFPLCYAVFTSPELCEAAVVEHFEGCEPQKIQDCEAFVNLARRRKVEVLIDLDAKTGEFSTCSPFEGVVGQA